jgi:hypothetical protein
VHAKARIPRNIILTVLTGCHEGHDKNTSYRIVV